MKKVALLTCAMTILLGTSVFAAENIAPSSDTQQKVPNIQEDRINRHKAREAAFEQKLGLTEAQKVKAKELRIQGREKMKPIADQIKAKKQEAKMVKLSRISVEMQEEKLAKIDKELAVLEKQANEIRKQNMKAFESILTGKQKKILRNMKKEGRQKYEKEHFGPHQHYGSHRYYQSHQEK